MSTHKHAVTQLPLLPAIKERWSPRAFAADKPDIARLKTIFEAARWSPSASNEQPWRFIMGYKGSETYQKIFSVLVEFNQLWAGSAPLLMLAVSRRKSLKNPGKDNAWFEYDLGQSMAYLSIQAVAEGLYVHQMGGFDAARAAELFGLDNNLKVVTVAAIGYPGDPDGLHPNLVAGEKAVRTRQALDEMVFTDTVGGASPDW